MTSIYTLSEPTSHGIWMPRYVGQTTDVPKDRFAHHISQRNQWNSHKNRWLNKMLRLGIKPRIDVIDVVPDEHADEAEMAYILLFNSFLPKKLTNGTNGGNSGKKLSDDAKQRMSEAHKGKRHSEETKRKMSQAQSGERHPNFGKKLSESHRRNMAIARKRIPIRNPKKPILQFEYPSGKFVQEWSSRSDIERKLKLNRGSITKCCQHKVASESGFVWRYKSEFEIVPEQIEVIVPTGLRRKIIAIELSSGLEIEFNSLLDAHKATGVHQAMMRHIISGRYKSTNGYSFRLP